jgi:glutamate-1-semialdehyde 2,1-aminomutase
VRVANLSTIWTVLYTQPSRYHWMLQFYLRAQGLALSWVGSGRLVFSLNYEDGGLRRRVRPLRGGRRPGHAARRLVVEGAGGDPPHLKRGLLRELLSERFGRSGSPGGTAG